MQEGPDRKQQVHGREPVLRQLHPEPQSQDRPARRHELQVEE
jgi:hypothetical protein